MRYAPASFPGPFAGLAHPRMALGTRLGQPGNNVRAHALRTLSGQLTFPGQPRGRVRAVHCPRVRCPDPRVLGSPGPAPPRCQARRLSPSLAQLALERKKARGTTGSVSSWLSDKCKLSIAYPHFFHGEDLERRKQRVHSASTRALEGWGVGGRVGEVGSALVSPFCAREPQWAGFNFNEKIQ